MGEFDMLGLEGLFLIGIGLISFMGIMYKTHGFGHSSLTENAKEWLQKFRTQRRPTQKFRVSQN